MTRTFWTVKGPRVTQGEVRTIEYLHSKWSDVADIEAMLIEAFPASRGFVVTRFRAQSSSVERAVVNQ